MSQNILLLGATSGVGLWTAHHLLESNHKVSVLCRNPKKLDNLFKGKSFEKVVTSDLEETVSKFEKDKKSDPQNTQNPFSEHVRSMDVVINCVGPAAQKGQDVVEHSRIIDLETNRLLIEASIEAGIKKFILVTSMFVTRPDSFIAFILNTMAGNCLGHKL